MDIKVYEDIINGLAEYNNNLSKNYGNVIVPYPTTNPTYPYTVFDEIRNVADRSFHGCHDKVASLGYRLDVYAKTLGQVQKQKIARELAQKLDEFLTNTVGLLQVSWNVENIENEASIYHIIITYTANLHENRRRII